MAALTQERIIDRRGSVPTQFTKACGVDVIYKGSMVARNGSGYAVPAETTGSTAVIGVAMQTVDNSGGSAGDKEVRLQRGVFAFENSGTNALAELDCPVVCYAEDDQTVGDTDASSTYAVAGIALGLTEDGQVLVYIGPEIAELKA